jgi:hypothetical protein
LSERIFHDVAEVVQSTNNAVAAPRRVLSDQFDDEFFKFRIHGWSPERVCPGKGPLLADKDSKPTEQTPVDGPGFASKPDALGVSEALGFAAEVFEENAVLFLEVFDDGLLMSIDPARDGAE